MAETSIRRRGCTFATQDGSFDAAPGNCSRRLTTSALLIALLATVTSANAQGQLLGAIHGTLKDQQGGVLPGVVVTATPVEPRPPIATITDPRGYYIFRDIEPGEYEIKAELTGFATVVQPGVLARAGVIFSLDLVMAVGTVGEQITVRRDPPLIDTSSPATAVNVKGEFQRAMPLSARRDWADFLSVTPGIVSQQTAQFPNYHLHGASAAVNVFQIDGIDATSAINNGNSKLSLSTEAIDDVNIKTSGVDASAPLGVGAVVNIATRSGNDRYSVSGGLVYQPRRWNGSNVPLGTSQRTSLAQPDVTVGGPLRPGRAWFFSSYRYTNISLGLTRSAEQLSLLRTLNPGFEPFDATTTAHIHYSKLTGAIGSRHQLQAIAMYDRTPYATYDALDAGPFKHVTQGGPLYALRTTSTWSNAWLSRLAVSYNAKKQEDRLHSYDVPARRVHRGTFMSAGVLQGTGVVARLDNSDNANFGGLDYPYHKLTLSADATHVRQSRIGAHEFQFGVYGQFATEQLTQRFPNDGFLVEDVLYRDQAVTPQLVPFHRRIYEAASVDLERGTVRDLAAYVQDTWRPTGRLSVNVGLRLDAIRRESDLYEQVIQDSVEIGPRFGVNYAVTSDHRTSVRVSAIRVHENVAETAVSAGTSSGTFRDLYDLDLDGSFETTLLVPGRTTTNSNLIFDGAFHQPFVDEITTGIRRQLPGLWMIGSSFTRRAYKDRLALIESNQVYDGVVFRGYADPSTNDVLRLTNGNNWPVYKAFSVEATRQGPDWQVLASYVRQWRHLDGTWQPHDPASFIQPDAFRNDKGLGFVYGRQNSLSGTAATGYQAWRDHALRLGAVYTGPFALRVATSVVVESGVWSGPVVTRTPAADPQFGPATFMFNGRLISNPLATTVRFAFADRGEGQLTTPWLPIWNVRVGKRLAFDRMRLDVDLDILNVVNAGKDQAFLSGANQLYSPNYGLTTNRQLPRAAQVSVRFNY